MQDRSEIDFVELSAGLISAYVSNNRVRPQDLAELIVQVHGAFANLASTGFLAQTVEPVAKLTPAQIRKSITPDALISFVDNRPYKTLKRHLSRHGLSVDQYRERYGLPVDYPAVAPNYSAARAALAKGSGLGQRRAKVEPVLADPVSVEASDKPKRRGRPKKKPEAESTPAA